MKCNLNHFLDHKDLGKCRDCDKPAVHDYGKENKFCCDHVKQKN